MTATKIAKRLDGTDGAVAIASEPMLIEPIAVGLRQNEPATLDAVNKALNAMEQSGEMSAIFNKWHCAKTAYGLVRTDKVTPNSQLKFTPVS